MQEHRSLPRTVWVVMASAIGMVALALLLYELRVALIWTSIALLIALATQPLVVWLTKRGLRRGLAVLIVFAVLIAVVALLLGTVVPMLIEQARALVRVAPDVIGRMEKTSLVEWADRHFGIVDALQEEVRDRASSVAAPAVAAAVDLLKAMAGAITILALSIFMLLFGGEVFRSALAWVEPHRREHWTALASRVRRVVGGYVIGTLLVSSIGGVVTGLTLVILGVPYFLALGLLMVIFGLIPIVGSFIGAVLIIGVTFATEGAMDALIVAGVYLAYQQVEGHLLHPVVQRRTLRMNPLIVALAVLAGTTLAGVFGALMALPVAGIIQLILTDVLARRSDRSRGSAPADRTAC